MLLTGHFELLNTKSQTRAGVKGGVKGFHVCKMTTEGFSISGYVFLGVFVLVDLVVKLVLLKKW